jgi:hypothetical protein
MRTTKTKHKYQNQLCTADLKTVLESVNVRMSSNVQLLKDFIHCLC